MSFGKALLVVEGPVPAELVAGTGYRARPAAARRAVEPRRPFWRSGAQALSTSLEAFSSGLRVKT